MTIAILPLRSLRDGKRRLQDVATADERRRLVETMFERAVDALARSGAIERVVVVSPDTAARAYAERLGAVGLAQPNQGLNEGLELARAVVAERWPAQPLLVVLPDLPFVEPGDVAGVVQLGAEHSVVIAPDRHRQGTNALWLPAGAAIPFSYGEGSYGRHRAAAEALGLAVRCYHGAGTAFDLDTAADLDQVRRRAGAPPWIYASSTTR